MAREQPRLTYDPADLAALAEPLPLLDTRDRRLTAPNRIVYQPMEANDAEPDGAPGEALVARYRARAEGRPGIEFVEAMAVAPEGRARPNQLVLTRENLPGFQQLVSAYREANPKTPILFQLTHSGRFALDPVAPYPVAGREARLLTDEDMEPIADRFVEATRLTAEAGADGIDFKHCHGYLASSLLGPANVARPGWSYGGPTLAARTRFLRKVLVRMMEAAPPDRFLYAVRFSAYEGIPGGFGSAGPESAEEELEREPFTLATFLDLAGVHLLNVSAGIPEFTPHLVRQTNDAPEGFAGHLRRAAAVKRAVGIPVVGSGWSYPKAGRNRLPGEDPAKKNVVTLGGRAVRAGRLDLIGVGRQSLADPRFAAKLLEGRGDEILWDDSCNRCAIALRSGIPAGCVTHDPAAKVRFRELRREERST